MIAWVAGASSGLGRAIALAMHDAGHTVIAGARSFTEGEMDGLHCLPLDVTDQASVDAFVKRALQIAPRVDVLVNAAAILLLGSAEETAPEDYRRVMETDFLGMVRMNRAVLPMMREQGRGRLIMLSSINGLLGIPFQSAYTAAKHAVEGYAECLAMETAPFGIQVCLVEPGDHRGGAEHTRLRADVAKDSAYAAAFEAGTAVIRHDEAHGSDPDRLGRKVAALLKKRRMPLRLRIASPDQHLAVILHDVLPGWLNQLILRGYYLGRQKN